MQDEAERLRAAVAHFRNDEHEQALEICRGLISRDAKIVGASNQLIGLVLNHEGDMEPAARHLRLALVIDPSGRAARTNLAVVEEKLGRVDQTARQFRLTLAVDPLCAEAWHGLARRKPGAGSMNSRALLIEPNAARFLEALADHVMDGANTVTDAARLPKWAFVANPGSTRIAHRAASFLVSTNRPGDALWILERALAGNERADLRVAAGYMLRRVWRNPEAVDHFRRALIQVPDEANALLGLMWCRRQACEWAGDLVWLTRALDLFLKAGLTRSQPAFALAWSSDPAEQLLAAQGVAHAHLETKVSASLQRRPLSSGHRIRVGYLSPHFGEHPVGRCVVELLERHDETRFEIFAYASKSHPGHPIHQRVRDGVDHLRDLNGASESEIRDRITSDNLDILIDLDGYSQGLPGVIAGRPAPVLVNYLGFPGTSGGLHDYIIGDRSTIARGTEAHYAENIVWMPHCYLPPPTGIDATTQRPTRHAEGLPEHGLVLAAFHTPYKITPEAFDAWCAIMRSVPSAVLWLLDGTPPHADVLRAAAKARDVSPDRLIFAGFRPAYTDHIARLPLADLYLDTFPHTAHSTAAELMYQGCPLVTRTGDAFASRVAASILKAANLPDLITDNWDAFVDKAVNLCSSPSALRDCRQRLAASRTRAPLFDRDGYARAFEEALTSMATRYRGGHRPAPIEIGRGVSDGESERNQGI
jgi:protein O-GlcNAc transferase